jgi:hypothetical protein
MAATRPSSAIRAGSPDSSRWWETKNFAEFTEAVHARWLSLRYALALEAYLEASRLAERAGDWSAWEGIAVNKASGWNAAVPAALSLMDAAERQVLRKGNQTGSAEAFAALEADRAASLCEGRELAPGWEKRRLAAYWETLGRLNEEQARHLSTRGTVSRQSRRLRLKLTELESAAGVGVSVMFAENFRTRNSLSLFQQGLGESDLPLRDVKRFREAVASDVSTGGGPAGDRLGAALYQRLSGALDPAGAAKTSRPLSLDGVLFELPRISDYENRNKDRREDRGQLSRLVSGSRELQRSSASWRTIAGVAWPIQILERTAARRDNCLQALSADGGPDLGAGLPGLSRAWMMAGSRAVVAFQVTGGGR